MSANATPQTQRASGPDTQRRGAVTDRVARRPISSSARLLAARREVEWVRVSDLAQRTGARLIQHGAQSHQQLRQMLAAARRDGAEYVRTALRERGTQVEAHDTGGSRGDGHSRRREHIGR